MLEKKKIEFCFWSLGWGYKKGLTLGVNFFLVFVFKLEKGDREKNMKKILVDIDLPCI